MQDIYVSDVGKGFPLVLIHGFLGLSAMWKPQVSYLKKNYRIISPDLPGFGNSNKTQSKNNINEMAKIVLSSLKEKKIDNFFLLGHSMGGMIVQEMAKLAVEKIKKLICYGVGPIGNIPGRFKTIKESRDRLKKDGLKTTAYSIANTWFVEEYRSKYFYLCDNVGKSTTLEAANNALVAMENWNGIKDLKNIKASTLIFKRCPHNVHLERPDEFNKCINEFLNQKQF